MHYFVSQIWLLMETTFIQNNNPYPPSKNPLTILENPSLLLSSLHVRLVTANSQYHQQIAAITRLFSSLQYPLPFLRHLYKSLSEYEIIKIRNPVTAILFPGYLIHHKRLQYDLDFRETYCANYAELLNTPQSGHNK
jgi:hypothetical protein